ncbi:MAG: UDP-N-acetylmuramate dehydrogenase [bacterium]
MDKLVNLIKQRIKRIKLNEPMSRYTSFHIGGPAELMVFPQTEKEILWLQDIAINNNISYFILGKGSNLLVRDKGVKGIVINMRYMNKFYQEGMDIIAHAGVSLSKLLSYCVQSGLKGIEFISGIPGSLGGAIIMNAGTYEGSIGQVIEDIKVAEGGEIKVLAKDEIGFGYRKSSIIEKNIILSARLRVSSGDKIEIRESVDELLNKRKMSQPYTLKSAGSFFKNPSGSIAAKLIDSLGLKGTQIGDAVISQKHANFIINKGKAKASEILTLADFVKEKVYSSFNIILTPEVRIIGEE